MAAILNGRPLLSTESQASFRMPRFLRPQPLDLFRWLTSTFSLFTRHYLAARCLSLLAGILIRLDSKWSTKLIGISEERTLCGLEYEEGHKVLVQELLLWWEWKKDSSRENSSNNQPNTKLLLNSKEQKSWESNIIVTFIRVGEFFCLLNVKSNIKDHLFSK